MQLSSASLARFRVCELVVAAGFFAGPVSVRGVDVAPGSDMFITNDLTGTCSTYEDFSGRPIPAGFFGAGSDPFTGLVCFSGVPLSGTGTSGADTIVERLETATLPGCGGTDTVAIQIRALSLVSSAPLTVTFNNGASSSTYSLRVCLSGVCTQPLGSMTITQGCTEGGTFTSTLPVIPKLTFTKLSGTSGLPSVVLDPPTGGCTADGTTFTLPLGGSWSYTDPGGMFGTVPSAGGNADHDCDGVTVEAGLSDYPATSNFIVGIKWSACDCIPGGQTPQPSKTLTEEEAELAKHGILPNQTPPGNCCMTNDVDGDGDIDCLNVTDAAACTAAGGVGLFFPTDICIAVPGQEKKLGDWCVPKGGQQPLYRDCPANPPPQVPEDCPLITSGDGACCLTAGVCVDNVPSLAQCQELGGGYIGDHTTCLSVNDCSDIPTVSEWGLVAMLLLVAAAATVVIQKRRALMA